MGVLPSRAPSTNSTDVFLAGRLWSHAHPAWQPPAMADAPVLLRLADRIATIRLRRPEHLAVANRAMLATNVSGDFKEGVASFRAERPPAFAAPAWVMAPAQQDPARRWDKAEVLTGRGAWSARREFGSIDRARLRNS